MRPTFSRTTERRYSLTEQPARSARWASASAMGALARNEIRASCIPPPSVVPTMGAACLRKLREGTVAYFSLSVKCPTLARCSAFVLPADDGLPAIQHAQRHREDGLLVAADLQVRTHAPLRSRQAARAPYAARRRHSPQSPGAEHEVREMRAEGLRGNSLRRSANHLGTIKAGCQQTTLFGHSATVIFRSRGDNVCAAHDARTDGCESKPSEKCQISIKPGSKDEPQSSNSQQGHCRRSTIPVKLAKFLPICIPLLGIAQVRSHVASSRLDDLARLYDPFPPTVGHLTRARASP